MLRLATLGGLSIDGGSSEGGVDVRPRRLALLAILAAAGATGLAREKLLAILWPEREPEKARHSLSQALYSLKRDLGTDVVQVSTTLRLDSSKIETDLDAFRGAIAAQDWERAAELFTGPFLDGFYLADAREFERWAEEERAAIMHLAVRAIEAAARDAELRGQRPRSAALWRRLTKLDPVNGRFALAYANALLALDDRAGALLHAQSHADLVRHELSMEPDTEVLQLITRLRGASSAAVPPVAPRSGSGVRFALRIRESRRSAAYLLRLGRKESSRRRAWSLLGAALVVAMAAFAWREYATRRARRGSNVPSPVAQRLYDDGLRAFYQFDAGEASRLFNAALAEDSTFAMAAYYAWQAERRLGGRREDSLGARAAVLASSASERDAALIREHLAAAGLDLHAQAAAESLAARYPNDADILMRAADVESELSHAVSRLDRAIAIDSVTSREASAVCRACDALRLLADRYAAADSFDLALRTVDRWIGLRSMDYQPWQARANVLAMLGRRREVEDALRRADSLGAPHDASGNAALVRHVQFDDLDSANRACAVRLASMDQRTFVGVRALCTTTLRMQGRYRDALALVHEGRVPGTSIAHRNAPLDSAAAAIVDLEMGRPLAAAAEFTSMADDAPQTGRPAGVVAHRRVWALTLAGAAAAAMGDTIRVRALTDSVELIGHRSLDPRDPLLHHFLRGLLYGAAGEGERAVREFAAASAPGWPRFTRVDYEMGKAFLTLNRPRDAIAAARAALHGDVTDAGMYLTRTEAHELLGRAFAAAKERDSAATHYAIVDRAWRSADSSFAPLYQSGRLAVLRGHGPKP